MPKKRRITQNQAWILAVRYVQRAVIGENIHADDTVPSPYGWVVEYAGDQLPAKWADGQTSDQSYEHVKEEVCIQVENIVNCLVAEARNLQKENPEFRAVL